MTPARRAVLDRVAAAVLALPAERTKRVGIDGVDGAGKTTFADELRDRPGSILLFDGLFLHRPELRETWDLSVFLRVEWTRNHRLRGAPPVDLEAPSTRRYWEGQELYFRECAPWDCASIVVDNDDLDAPF